MNIQNVISYVYNLNQTSSNSFLKPMALRYLYFLKFSVHILSNVAIFLNETPPCKAYYLGFTWSYNHGLVDKHTTFSTVF